MSQWSHHWATGGWQLIRDPGPGGWMSINVTIFSRYISPAPGSSHPLRIDWSEIRHNVNKMLLLFFPRCVKIYWCWLLRCSQSCAMWWHPDNSGDTDNTRPPLLSPSQSPDPDHNNTSHRSLPRGIKTYPSGPNPYLIFKLVVMKFYRNKKNLKIYSTFSSSSYIQLVTSPLT